MNCAGMIWSVSTLTRGSGATIPVSFLNGSMSLPLPYVHEVAGDGRRRRHLRAHEVGAPALPLPPLEVAVGAGGAALARLQDVRVHPQAHRAAGLPPLEPGVDEDSVQPFLLR